MKTGILNNYTFRQISLWLLLSVMVSAVFFSPCIKNGFITGWDDEFHLLNNTYVRSLDAENIKGIFTTTVNKLYLPLTTLSFAVESHFAGYSPFIYHFTNYLLHLAIVALIFWFGMQIGLSPAASGVASMIFGIHPMHVESVAWITERKDVLYAFFYLLSVNFYWKYSQNASYKSYVLSLIFALLSILSKPMALSLPLILWLCDWLNRRNFSVKLFWDKVPFFFIVVPVLWISYSQHVRVPFQDLWGGIGLWAWTFVFYPIKFFIPIGNIPFYTIPKPISLSNSQYILSFFVLMAFLYGIFRFRRNRWVVFAFFYYFLSIFFLLRFDDTVDAQVVADRFMYLPSLGLCYVLGRAAEKLIDAGKNSQPDYQRYAALAAVLVMCVIVLLGNRSYEYCKVWKNNKVFWDYVVKTSPDNPGVYYNRAVLAMKAGDYDSALKDYTASLKNKPNYTLALNNRAMLYNTLKKFDLAIEDYDQLISLDSRWPEGYINRGLAYHNKGLHSKALEDYNTALKLNPDLLTAYTNRGLTYKALGQYDLAIKDFDTILERKPGYLSAYINRAAVRQDLDQYDLAAEDYTKALVLSSREPEIYNSRASVFVVQKKWKEALEDYSRAVQLQPNNNRYHINRGNLYVALGQYQNAIGDYDAVVAADPKNIDVYFNRGVAYTKLKDFSKALQDFSRVLQFQPKNAMALMNRAFIYYTTENLEGALEDFQQALTLDPSNREAYYFRSKVYQKKNDHVQALKDAQRAKSLGVSNIDQYIMELEGGIVSSKEN